MLQGNEHSDVIIDDASRAEIRAVLLQLVFGCPDAVERQLGEAIALVGQRDFPQQWQELLPALVAEFRSTDQRRVYSALRTSHALFKRYRHEMKSDDLWREIKLVLEHVRIHISECSVELLCCRPRGL